MLANIDYLIVIIYLVAIMGLGLYASRGIKNLNQYAVAGRNYSAPVVFATLSAAFIGGGFTLGNAEKVFMWGIVNIFALWGFSFKEILVAKYIAPRMQAHRDAISIGDIMVKSYGTPGRLISGICGVLLCVGIIGAQVGAMGYVFETFLGISRIWGIMLGCGTLIVYVTLGGIRAVVVTEILQFGVLAIGLPLALIFSVMHAGGIDAVLARIPADHLTIPGSHLSWIAFISLFLTFMLGETLVPPYLQRLLIGKDIKSIAQGTLWSGLFSIPFFAITGCLGLVALALQPDLNPNLAVPYLVQTALPVGIVGLVIASIICVVMSSAESFLNAASVAFTNDIVKPLMKKPLSATQELRLAKIFTLFCGVGAVVMAVKVASILDILIYAYHFWAPMMVVPLIAAIFGFRANTKVYLSSVACGFVGMWIWQYALNNPFGLEGLIVGVIMNTVSLYLGQKFLNNEINPAIQESV
ncbi:MAG: sodium:solute symporter family protein [Legionellales bacterium]|jgi:SSS family solute:Na+ symporter